MPPIGRAAGVLAVILMVAGFALVGAAAVGAHGCGHKPGGCGTPTSTVPTTQPTQPPTTTPTTKPKPKPTTTSSTTTTTQPPGGAVQPTTTTTSTTTPPPAAPPTDGAPPAAAPTASPPAPSNDDDEPAGPSDVATALGPQLPAAPTLGPAAPPSIGAIDVPPLPGAVLTDDSVLIPGSIALLIAAAGLGMLFLVMQGAAGKRAAAAATVPVDDGRTLEFQ